jgi:hypothetical protein
MLATSEKRQLKQHQSQWMCERNFARVENTAQKADVQVNKLRAGLAASSNQPLFKPLQYTPGKKMSQRWRATDANGGEKEIIRKHIYKKNDTRTTGNLNGDGGQRGRVVARVIREVRPEERAKVHNGGHGKEALHLCQQQVQTDKTPEKKTTKKKKKRSQLPTRVYPPATP